MYAEFEGMLAYMLAAKAQVVKWLHKQAEVAATLRTFVQNLEALLSAHGLRLRLNSQRHHSTVRITLYLDCCKLSCTFMNVKKRMCQTPET